METQTSTSTDAKTIDSRRYGKALETSRRVRWDIDRDVFRGRQLDLSNTFLPEGLSLLSSLPFLDESDRRSLSQIEGRTYANVFGLVERFINAKVLELSRDHWLGDQTALEALVGFSQEELKHQEMFRRIEQMIAMVMPPGYTFLPKPDDVASAVLGKSTWAVLALTCHIELFTQVHYRQSIEPDPTLSPLFKDVFLFHWKEESQHAILDELEWMRADRQLTSAGRDGAVDDLIALVGAIDGMLQAQAAADVEYFATIATGRFSAAERTQVEESVLRAYRWQYIVSGVQHPRFLELLVGVITPGQVQRVTDAVASLTS
ncbi:MAG: hypothetical protein ACJ780_25025 [Solirubrobacteraceae bacterium]